jgi:O-antigen/teichoic acid export membrane protein
MNLIGDSVSNVYYAECASLRATNPKRIKELSNKLLKTLMITGLIPLVTLLFFGPMLFSFVFGSEWVEAGVYARLLAIAVFSRFVFKPISNIFDIFEKQKIAFWLNVLRFLLVMVVFGISKYLVLSAYWTVGLYSVSMSLIYYVQYVLAQKIIDAESINQVEVD